MGTTTFDDAVDAIRAGGDAEEQARRLLGLLSDTEKLGLLDGDEPFWRGMRSMVEDGYNHTPYVHGSVPRLGIPGLRFGDGPRGVVLGNATAFPVAMARGATWDTSLEERVGGAIGLELRALGSNFFGGICINLPRHPAWGRIQETYGEDPVLLGDFGAALHRGVAPNAMTTVKHYALNSMENARFTVDVTVAEDVLHESYLPHFRRVVEEGADAVMTAYNAVNGEWAGQNRHLITDVLRDEWGFGGIAVSDFIWGLRDAVTSLTAGLDVEEPFAEQRALHLPAALAERPELWQDVAAAALRILGVQLRFAARKVVEEPSASVVFQDAHRALAREVAARSMVLLKNEPVEGAPVLPLTGLRSLAVVGSLAARANTGDNGSSDVRSPEVVAPLEGLRAALPDVRIDAAGDEPDEAAALAAAADAAIVVVGYTAADEGEFIDAGAFLAPDLVATYPPTEGDPWAEAFLASGSGAGGISGGSAGGDRASLRLHADQVALIQAVAAANPRTVVVIVAAGAVLTEEWRAAVPAVLLAWYSGSEGGHALADVLLGAVDVAGRLPFSVPTSESHLPAFDPAATAVTYDRWFGQHLLDRLGVPAAFPLGFGLSYTSFTLRDLILDRIDGDSADVIVTVANTGDRDGRTVVQVYGDPRDGAEALPARALLGYRSVPLAAGEERAVTVRVSLRPLQRWTPSGWVRGCDEVLLRAAAHAADGTGPTAVLDLAVALP